MYETHHSFIMKVLIVLLVVLISTTVLAVQNQYPHNSNQNLIDNSDGTYIPDNSGEYISDDSGRYIPDYSGQYHPDGLGGYKSDGSGGYRSDGSGGYQGNKDQHEFGRNFDRTGRFGNGNNKYRGSKQTESDSSNLLGQATTLVSKQTPAFGKVYERSHGGFGKNAGTSHPAVLPISQNSNYDSRDHLDGATYRQERYVDGKWNIISQSADVDTDGYHWAYDTENGITAEESGKLHNRGTDLEGMKAKGFYKYTGPNNVPYYVGYTADENGFLAEGNHLPTPPPIPELILKSLAYLKSVGKL